MLRPSRVCPGVTGMSVVHVLLSSSYELGIFQKGGWANCLMAGSRTTGMHAASIMCHHRAVSSECEIDCHITEPTSQGD